MVEPTGIVVDPKSGVIGVSVAGGIGRQYRVQFQDTQNDDWRHYAAFQNGEDARRCQNQLRQDGLTSRVIRYGHCPTAA